MCVFFFLSFFLVLFHFHFSSYSVFSYANNVFVQLVVAMVVVVVLAAATVVVLVMMVCTFVSAFVLYLLFVLVRSFFYVVFLPLLRLLPRFCT